LLVLEIFADQATIWDWDLGLVHGLVSSFIVLSTLHGYVQMLLHWVRHLIKQRVTWVTI